MAEVMSFVMMVFIVVPVLAPTVGGLFLRRRQLAPDLRLPLRDLARLRGLDGAPAAGDAARPRCASRCRSPGSLGSFGEAVGNRQTLGYTAGDRRDLRLADGLHQLGRADLRRGLRPRRAASRSSSAPAPRRSRSPPSSTAASSGGSGCGGSRTAHARLRRALARAPRDRRSPSGGRRSRVFVVLLALTLLCFGLMMPNFNALAMEPMGRIAGTASSFVGAVTTGGRRGARALRRPALRRQRHPAARRLRRLRRCSAPDRARHRARPAVRRRHLLTSRAPAHGSAPEAPTAPGSPQMRG